MDRRVPKNKKIIISCILGYLVMPIDLIPDFIPVLGFIDDLIIVVLGINILLTEIDKKIILDNWPGKHNLLEIIKTLSLKIEETVQAPFLRKMKSMLEKFEKSQ